MTSLVSGNDAKGTDTKGKVTTPTNASDQNSSSDENESQRTGHYGSVDDHVFADPATADYWRNKYEKAGYENRHRFDSELTWTAEEERKIVRKVCDIMTVRDMQY
jgi:hypothetical protein